MSDGREGGEEPAQVVSHPHDRGEMLAEVLEGLSRPDKRIPSKYHYDARGSALFEDITRLEEYYPTRTERALLERWIPVWVGELSPRGLVELGPGSADKSRILLDAMTASDPDYPYVPVDVSGELLHDVAEKLRRQYPELHVAPVVADITRDLDLPVMLPTPVWIAFLGSTLGNFEDAPAVELLRRIRGALRPDDRFLLGVDLRPGERKTRERLELAYNDPGGVTEEFSRNVLRVLNRELGSDFDVDAFGYRSVYNETKGRIETYQDSLRAQTVRFPGGVEIELGVGEPILTEISAKYDRPTIDALFARSGLAVERWVEDSCGYYALVLATPLPAGREVETPKGLFSSLTEPGRVT